MKLNFIKTFSIIEECLNTLGKHFENLGTFDYTKEELQNDNIIICNNNDLTYFSILRIEDDFIHYDFSWLKENLRGKGNGTLFIKQIIEYCKSNFNKDIRATARLSNIASCNSLLKAGFFINNTDLIDQELCYEFIYRNFQFNKEKYISKLPSSCGLSALSFILDWKGNYIHPDELKVPCIKNKGIPKEIMLDYLQYLLKSREFKLISNLHMKSEDTIHLLENHLTNKYNIALCCVDSEYRDKYDLSYEHWIIIIEDTGTHFKTFDNLNGFTIFQKNKFYNKMMFSNMFTILL